MDNDRRQTRRDRQNRITRISQQIDNLSTELSRLIVADNQDQQNQEQQQRGNRPTRTADTPINQREEYNEGDRVVITNNYKGQRGTVGVITGVTRHQVSLRIEGQRRVINKKKSNIRKIE